MVQINTGASSRPFTRLWSRRAPLLQLNPLQQLRAGRFTHRLVQLLAGLWLYGVAIGMFVRAHLGLDPWDVFHYGIMRLTGLSLGTMIILVGFIVLLAWIPLRQWPGLGTLANAIVIGIATDATLAVLPEPRSLVARWAFLLAGIVLQGIASAMYIGSQFGAGPRDGLMTGICARTGWPVKWVRMAIEVLVLAVGWSLGGVVGIGTVLYAVLIGPIIHIALPMLTVRVQAPVPSVNLTRQYTSSTVISENESCC